MGLIRFAVKVLLVMFVLPALGLLAFHGSIWSGLGAALLIGIVGAVTAVALIPAIFVGLVGGAAAGGAFGARVAIFGVETVIYSITLGIVAWLMSSVALVGFWPTVGAGAILALASNLLTSHSSK